MAGDWIKMRAGLFTHPKVVRISSALKVDVLRTVGGLMSVWCLFDEHSEDGRLDGYTLDAIDDRLRLQGFAQSMINVGWLEDHVDGALFLPRFDTHNGQSAKRRAQDADRKRDGRKTSAPEADKIRTREEKRREEKSISEANASGGKPPTNEEIIFSYGLNLLVNAGSTDKHARSFLGGLRKGRDDSDVVNALRDCIRAKPLQPMEWLAAALPPAGSRSKPNAQEALEAQNREVGRRFLEKEALNAPQ